MKKIYFACSITGGRDHAHVYPEIVKIIKDAGMHVLSEAFADPTIKSSQGLGMKKGMAAEEVWQWDLNWLEEAHAIIAEVTQPSLGVGYEIAKAHEYGKPVLALYHPRPGHRLTAMVKGAPNVLVFEYQNVEETKPVIAEFVQALG